MSSPLSPLDGPISRQSSFAAPGAAVDPTRSPVRSAASRADDALPRGTVFRWNPYVTTPVNHRFQENVTGGSPGDPRAMVRNLPSLCIVTPRSEANTEHLSPSATDDGSHLPPSATSAGALPADHSGFSDGTSLASARGPASTVDQMLQFYDDSTDSTECLLRSLIPEQRDSDIRDRVLALPLSEAQRLYQYLVRFPAVSMHLCLKERGRIFAEAIEVAAQSLRSTELYRWMLAHAPILAPDQSGCIALTRVYDVVTPAQQAQLDDWICINFVELAIHPYGNYVVQRVITAGNQDVMDSFSRQLCSTGILTYLTQSKPGSHVVERFISTSSVEAAIPVCQVLLADHNLVQAMSVDKFGNYVLQSALKRVVSVANKESLATHATQTTEPPSTSSSTAVRRRPERDWNGEATSLLEICRIIVPALVADSPHAINIHRALGIPVPPAVQSSKYGRISAADLRRTRAAARR